MKKILLATTILLTACTSTEGLSVESSRPPLGNLNSSILVEEFSDIQCPACRGVHANVFKKLMEQYGKTVRYEFKHFPLRSIHPYAQSAAEAAECAADQGKFWEYLEDSYALQNKLTQKDLIARAEKLNILDMDLFTRCVNSRIKRETVDANFDEGIERGVGGTPTFFVNGERVERNTFEEISDVIEEKIAGPML